MGLHARNDNIILVLPAQEPRRELFLPSRIQRENGMHNFSYKRITGLVLGCLVIATASLMALPQAKKGAPEAKSGGNAAAKAMKNPVKTSPQSIEAGQKAYQTACTPCHGATGKGDGSVAGNLKVKPSNLVDDKWDHGSTDGEIFVNIRDGIGPDFAMKAFKGKVPDQDIWNIVNYLHSIGPKK
jgi:mono/diheme cytochrome c family protein